MKKKVSNKIAITIIIAIIIVMITGMGILNYAETTEAEIGTNVKASFNSLNGRLTIRTENTSTIGTIDKSLLNSFVNGSDVGGKTNVITIAFSNEVYAPQNSSNLFYNYSKLTEFVNLTNLNTTNVTDMSRMFAECSSLTNLNVSNFNTSKVTDMSRMFAGCSSLTNLNVSNFNTTNVTDMSRMFERCSLLTSLNVSNFNTSKVTDMSSMFVGCSSLTNLNLSNFNTTNVTDMSGMFAVCSSLTNLNVSNFNTTNVTDMSEMFTNCKALTNIDVSNFTTTNVTDMSSMFKECEKLNDLYLNNFDTSKVTNMKGMFFGCKMLTSLNLNNFNTLNVTDMSEMFHSCYRLKNFDVTGFDTSNVVNMSGMFFSCYSIKELNLSNFDTSKVKTINNMFDSCYGLESLNLSSFNIASAQQGSFLNYCYNLNDIYTPISLNSINLSYGYESTGLFSRDYYNADNVNDNNLYSKLENDTFTNSVHLKRANTILYYTNGGKGTTIVKLKRDNVNETIETNTFTSPEGATFAGWNTGKLGNGTTYNPGDIYTENSTLKLYAQWEYNNSENPEVEEINKLSDITSNSYGKYIDLGQNVLGSSSTNDDWRILYNDKENNKVYAILSSNLPISYITDEIATNLKIDIVANNGIFFKDEVASSDDAIEILKNNENWSFLLPESISESAKIMGSPTWTLIASSYNERYNITDRIVGEPAAYTYASLSDTNLNLYLSNDATNPEIAGYFLASKSRANSSSNNLCYVDISNGLMVCNDYRGYYDYNYADTKSKRGLALRPVIELDGNIRVQMNDDGTMGILEIKDNTVTFKDGNEVIKTEIVQTGESATAPQLTKEGYTLSWDNDFSNITEDTIVNAIWTANTDTSYKIEYYLRDNNTEVEGYYLDNELTKIKTGTTDTIVNITNEDKIEIEGFTFDENNSRNVLSTNINPDGSGVMKLYYKRNNSEFYIRSNKYDIGENDITKVSPNTTVESFKEKIDINGTVTVKDKDGQTLNNDALVTTASTLEVEYNGHTYTYEIAVRGDINGDGKVSLIDLSLMNQHLVRKIELTGIKAKAADVNYDGKIALLDSSLINQHLVGKIEL